MATSLKSNGGESAEGTSNAGHNVANISKVIRECAGQMIQIKTERGKLNERAGDIRERLKDAGVQTQAFDLAVRLQDMEQQARDDYLDSLKLNFAALSIGATLDMFTADAPDPETEVNRGVTA